jgi:hypothetical protein
LGCLVCLQLLSATLPVSPRHPEVYSLTYIIYITGKHCNDSSRVTTLDNGVEPRKCGHRQLLAVVCFKRPCLSRHSSILDDAIHRSSVFKVRLNVTTANMPVCITVALSTMQHCTASIFCRCFLCSSLISITCDYCLAACNVDSNTAEITRRGLTGVIFCKVAQSHYCSEHCMLRCSHRLQKQCDQNS